MKILVVDDSRTIRAGMANLIGRMGHAVIEAANGEEALRLFAEERPELVLIDVMMPVMDGYEAAKRMRQSQGDDDWVPIIFLSSMEADQDLDRAIDAGGDDYLVKPVSFVVLNAKIRALHRTESVRRKLVEASGTLVTLNKELENLSRHDGLTELANRRYLDESLLTEVRRAVRAREPLSFILADIDHFKTYNDHYGHPAGDACLKQIATVLRAAARRPADLAARYGGEEFAMVLPETPLEGAITVAKTVARGVSELGIEHARSSTGKAVTLSQGIVSCVPGPESSPAQLIERADRALYEAKHQGRNRYVAFAAQDAKE
jgi:diguanylate cyclase (GGDEF)-like protein